MTSRMLIPARAVHRAEEDSEELRSRYLRERGWEYRSDNPGSLWLWVGKLPNGSSVRCDKDTAFCLQSEMTPDPEEEGDDSAE